MVGSSNRLQNNQFFLQASLLVLISLVEKGMRKGLKVLALHLFVTVYVDRTRTKVFRSEEIPNDLNPEWKPAVIPVSVLCGGDFDCPLLIEVLDHERSGKHVPMGSFETTLNGFLQMGQKRDGICSIKLTRKGEETGTIVIDKATVHGTNGEHDADDADNNNNNNTVDAPSSDSIHGLATDMHQVSLSDLTPIPPPMSMPPGFSASIASTPRSYTKLEPSFVDYISGGCEINVAVAIDFTGSNGDPRTPGTLHHLSPKGGERNDYEKAIVAIVSILSKFDSDEKYPV
jgi:hypothetical protein